MLWNGQEQVLWLLQPMCHSGYSGFSYKWQPESPGWFTYQSGMCLVFLFVEAVNVWHVFLRFFENSAQII